MATVNVVCGWCRKSFGTDNKKELNNPKSNKWGYGIKICPYCGRRVRSSIITIVDIVGRKHQHRELKNGDIV